MSQFDNVTTELNAVLKRYNIVGVMIVIATIDGENISEGGVMIEGDTNHVGGIIQAAKLHDPRLIKILKVATGRPNVISGNAPN